MELSNSLIKFLEYGIPGLSAIIIILSYFLLRTQNNRETPSEIMLKTIKSFMWIALVFTLVSGTVALSEKWMNVESVNDQKKKSDQSLILLAADVLASELSSLNARYRYSSSDGYAIKGGSNIQALSEEELEELGFKEEMTDDEFQYRKLKQAVFITIKDYGSDKELLAQVIDILIKRGFSINEKTKILLLDEFEDLLALRYQWVQNVAIDQAQRQLGARGQSMEQSLPSAEVPLPKEVWIFTSPQEGKEPKVQVTLRNIEDYRNELELLKVQIN